MAGIRLPLQSHPLQALVSELLEPVHPTVVMSNAVHVYVSQAHKGELVMGAGIDAYNGYGQRGAFHIIEQQMAAALELFPIFARAHVLRTWGGIVDVTPDASPIVGRTPVDGLYLNCGWGTGGFKATPGRRLVSTPTPSPTARRTRWPRRSPWTGSPPARWSTSTAPPRWPTETEESPRDAAHPLPVVRPPRRGRVPLRRAGRRRLPGRPRRAHRRRVGRGTCSSGTTRRARSPSAGATRAGCRRWFNLVRDTVTNEIRGRPDRRGRRVP